MLTDTQARIIASWWQAPRPGLLAYLASTGAIQAGIVEEIGLCIAMAELGGMPDDTQALLALIRYINGHGSRGPVPQWHTDCTWDSREEQEVRDMFSPSCREDPRESGERR